MEIDNHSQCCRYEKKFGYLPCSPSYIVFGSKSSEDCDVIVNIPFDVMNKTTNNMLIFNAELDKILGNIIGTKKEVNSCFGFVKTFIYHNFLNLFFQSTCLPINIASDNQVFQIYFFYLEKLGKIYSF
jgi:hypothetical protein